MTKIDNILINVIIYKKKRKEKGNMRLFWRRPLCFSCFLFLIISFVFSYVPTVAKPWIFVFSVLASLVSLCAFFIIKTPNARSKAFIVFMSIQALMRKTETDYEQDH